MTQLKSHVGLIYLLLTEFEVRTVSYGSSFFAQAIKQRKKRGAVTNSTELENEVSKIFIVSLRLIERTGNETFKVSWLYSKLSKIDQSQRAY